MRYITVIDEIDETEEQFQHTKRAFADAWHLAKRKAELHASEGANITIRVKGDKITIKEMKK